MTESGLAAASQPALVNGSARVRIQDFVRLSRPHHWAKNVVVLAPLLFSHSLDSPALRVSAVIAYFSFCFASSSVYIFNDLQDRHEDRLHQEKSHRPIASGKITPAAAIRFLVCGLALTLLFASRLSPAFQIFLGAYVVLNLAYSSGLKKVVILDAMMVAFGFVLRAEAGSSAISVVCTVWLVVCTFTAALMVSFGKRRQEFAALRSGVECHRSVLREYSKPALDAMLIVSAVSALLSYASYCLDKSTAARIGSPHLIVSLPFAIFGIFRFILLVYSEQSADITRSILRDRPLLLNFALWLLTTLGLLYLPPYSFPG